MGAPKGHLPFRGSETGGRPRRYSTEDIEQYANEFKVWLENPMHIWFKDFCLDNDIDPDLMAEWAKENEKFSGVYKIAKHRQESRLVNGGLTNQFNAGFAKFVLSNAHGWEKEQTYDNRTHLEKLAQAIRNESFSEAEDGDSQCS